MTLTFKVGTGSSFNPAAATDLGNQVVRLGTVSLTQAAEAGSVSFSGIQFDDPTSTVVIPALRPFWVDETAASPARLWTGYLTDRQYARQPSKSLIVGAAREIDPTLVDLNAVFGIRILRGSGTRRPVETVSARLAWLLGAMSPSVFDNGQVGSITDRTMPKTDYRFMFPEDVLKDCAGTVSANYFAYWDGSANQVSLFFQRNTYTGYTSSLRLTNHASDVDNVTTFFADISLKKDPSRVYSGIGYTHAGGFVYRQNAGTAAAFISRDMTVTTGAKPSRAVAIQRADQLLLGHAAEAGLVIVKAVLPKDKVNLALVGQYIQVKADHLEAYTSFTSNRITHRTVQQDRENPDIYTVTFELFDPQVLDGGPPALPLDTSPFQQSCDVGTVDYGTDLALSHAMTAQGDLAAAAHDMDKMVDGNGATYGIVDLSVVGPGTHICRMYLDFGTATNIGATGLYCNGDPGPLLSVEYSSDASSWAVAVSGATIDAGPPPNTPQTYSFTPVSARYWSLTYTTVCPSGLCVSGGAGIYTWSLYGVGATDCNEPTYAQPIPPEQAGTGNGTTKCYTTNYPYLPGSLRVTVNGISTTPEETSPSTGGFCIPFAPPAGAQIVVTYQADNGTATGANNPAPSPSYTATFPVSTHKGDIIASDGSNWQVHSGGSNYQVLTRDTAQPLGVKWAEPSNSGVTGITSNGSNSLIGLVNLAAGTGIALGVSSQTITITNTVSGGGGGGGGSTDAILGQSGQGGARISGLQASPDITVGGTNDQEFDSSTIGGTALGSPTSINANTTVKSNLYIKKTAASGFSLHGRYWSVPSMPFTMTAKLTACTPMSTNFMRVVMGIAEAAPGKTEGMYFDYNSGRLTSTVSSSTPTTGAAYVAQGSTGPDSADRAPLWFRVVVASSTDITWYKSWDGIHYRLHGTANRNPGFTIGSYFLAVDAENTTYDIEASWDWVRFT